MTQMERELFIRVAAHDQAAFEQLCTLYQATLHRHLAHIVRTPDAADDLLQETLIRVWLHAEQWDGRGAPRAWLFRVATNVALNALRAERRHPQTPLTPPDGPDGPDGLEPDWLADPGMGPEELAERVEQQNRLRSLIAELPEEKREVVRMIHGDELSVDEAARLLGIPPGTVRSRLHYATRRLARAWQDTED